MKILHCIICNKHRKIEKPKISCLLEKKILSFICSKCKNKDKKMFKEEESVEILKTISLINNLEEHQKI